MIFAVENAEHSSIDAAHSEIARMIEELINATSKKTDWLALHSAIEDIQEKVAVHFQVEESLMHIYQYPKLPDHTKKHRKYLSELQNIRGKVVKNTLDLAELENIRFWWNKHTAQSDRRYAKWFEMRPASSFVPDKSTFMSNMDGAGI